MPPLFSYVDLKFGALLKCFGHNDQYLMRRHSVEAIKVTLSVIKINNKCC